MPRDERTSGEDEGGSAFQISSTLGKSERRERLALWILMIVGLGLAGVAFVYKVAEFLFTLGTADLQGFADVPVTVYFVVATGWLCLLSWSFLSGKLVGLERSKYEMLELEEEYERRGE